MSIKQSVLVYLLNKGKVCLGMKKIRYGQGKWNGFGGKIEPDESKEEAAVREVWEETGLKIQLKDLVKKASFYYHESPQDWEVEVYTCDKWKGEIKESDEMKPEWFDIKKLPYEQMWENDVLWIEKVLTSSPKIKGTFWHDDKDRVIKYELKEE